MSRCFQAVICGVAFTTFIGTVRGLVYAGDLEDDHGLIPNIAYVPIEADHNTNKLVAAIELGEPLTCDSGGEFWFDDPLPLPPAHRVKNTAYATGDRVLADGNRIHVCMVPGTSANSYAAPAGTGANQNDGPTLTWDYVEEALTWDRNGLNIRGPTSQHAPQAIEEYGYLQVCNLRFNVPLSVNSDTWMKLDDDTPPAWLLRFRALIVAFRENFLGFPLPRELDSGEVTSFSGAGPRRQH